MACPLDAPPEVNLSDPVHEAGYASASFTDAEGTTFRGGAIRPSIAPVECAGNAPAAQEVLEYLFSADGAALLKAKRHSSREPRDRHQPRCIDDHEVAGGNSLADRGLYPHQPGDRHPLHLSALPGQRQGHHDHADRGPPNPAFRGVPAILVARVTPFNAAGTVQFMDGATALGAPVPVSAGFAITGAVGHPITLLAAGGLPCPGTAGARHRLG